MKLNEQEVTQMFERGRELLKEFTRDAIARELPVTITDKTTVPIRIERYVLGLLLAERLLAKNLFTADVDSK